MNNQNLLNVRGNSRSYHSIHLVLKQTNQIILTHNNISGNPTFKARAKSKIKNNNTTGTDGLANQLRTLLNNYNLLRPSAKEMTRLALENFVKKIIESREAKRQEVAGNLQKHIEYSTYKIQAQKNLKKAENNGRNENAKVIRNSIKAVNDKLTVFSDHSLQIIAWRWVLNKVIPKIFN